MSDDVARRLQDFQQSDSQTLALLRGAFSDATIISASEPSHDPERDKKVAAILRYNMENSAEVTKERLDDLAAPLMLVLEEKLRRIADLKTGGHKPPSP